jgi:hypothetical protein
MGPVTLFCHAGIHANKALIYKSINQSLKKKKTIKLSWLCPKRI